MAMVVCMMPAAVFAAGETGITENATLITEKMVSVSGGSVYDGTEKKPITVNDSSNLLTEGTDYDVKWVVAGGTTEVESLKDAGTYSAVVTGKGKYTGTVNVKSYTITPYNLNSMVTDIRNQLKPQTGKYALPTTGSDDFYKTVKFYVASKELSQAELENLFGKNLGKLNVSLVEPATANDKYKASFTVSDTANFTGGINPASFNLVENIESAAIKKKNDSNGAVILDLDGGEYDGRDKDISSLFSLYTTGSSTPLTYGVDYTIECADKKSVGTRTVTINGIGKYGSSKKINLVIGRRDAQKHVVPNTLSEQTEDAVKDKTVKPVLRDKDLGTELKENEDYQITEVVGTAGGNGYVRVAFMNNYEGTAMDVPFKVVSNDNNVNSSKFEILYNNQNLSNATNATILGTSPEYNGSAQPLTGFVVYSDRAKNTILSSTYYTISYEYVDSKGKTVATTSPIDAKNYSVYLVGRNGYAGKRLLGKYNIQRFTMNGYTVDVNVYMANAVATPTVTVRSKYGNITFTKDKDFTFSSSVNASKGTVTVYVNSTPYGNLTGSTSVTSPITAKSITSCSASFVNNRNSAIYTGYVINPDVIVRDGYTTLTKGTHYKVVYKNAAGKTVSAIKDAGTYTVEIQGMGAYVGTLTLYFTVTGNDISNYTVTLKENSVNATGMIQIPRIDSVKSGNKVLATSNYTVSYQDATGKTVSIIKDPGTYKVVVTGKGAYSGSTYATYRVVGLTQTITTGKDSYKAYPTTDDFDLNAKSDYALSKLTYTSSNPAVASVSANGTVTINKVGRAVITINASQVGKYEAASKSVIIKVYPKKTVITRSLWTGGNTKQFKVRWNYQDGATKYQIRYSRYSDFNKYSTKNVASRGNNNYATQTNTVKKLRSNTKYFVKVRAIYVDEESGAVYYGRWSSVRSIKTK